VHIMTAQALLHAGRGSSYAQSAANGEQKIRVPVRTPISNSATSRDGQNWYAAQVLPQKEGYAAMHLERQGFRTFFPRFYRTRTHARKSETVLRSLFPGYIFVAFDVERDRWLSVNSTRGVIRLVGPRSNSPQPVPDQAMQMLRGRCRADVVTKLPDDMKVGDGIQINAGPLAGQIAVIESMTDDHRIRVLMNILGADQAFFVDAGQLSPVAA
jgi:transcriptional antiterminator RfaH